MVNAFKHQLFDCFRVLGMRDRLRCPGCKAVGTWKPHGGWLDGHDIKRVRRWMCKYCGLYHGPEDSTVARPGNGAWKLDGSEPTPKETLHSLWPWRG